MAEDLQALRKVVEDQAKQISAEKDSK